MMRPKLSDQARDDAQRRTKRLHALVEEWRNHKSPYSNPNTSKAEYAAINACADELEKALDGDLL